MESSDTLELNKFIDKAPGYKEALHFAPLARVIEIFAIIGVIDGFIKSRGLLKSEVVIAEIMAGNGYLSNFLVKAGYRSVHSLEASNPMTNDTNFKNKFITLHAIEGIYNIDETLKSIRPNIIVSIAGFHHMLEHDGELIDVKKSINKQRKVVDICMKRIEKNGLLVIEDIRDNDMDDLIDNESEYWNVKSFKNIFVDKSELIPVSCRNGILKTNDIAEYSSIVSEYLMPPSSNNRNPTTRWFHDVIDKETKVGHKDIPIGKNFIENLITAYKVSHVKINTPWLFSSISEYRSFITSFWFAELKDNTNKMNDIFNQAEKINGLRNLEATDRVSFGWNLALLTIQSKEQDPPSLFYQNIVGLLSSIIVISLIGIALKANTTLHFMIDVISNILVFLTGVSAKEIYDKFKRK